jgi:hypothetical protein
VDQAHREYTLDVHQCEEGVRLKPEESEHAERSMTSCSNCGTTFHCGRDDEAGCWCARLPTLPPDRYDTAAGCLCEACLNRMLAAAAAQPRPR